MRPTHLFRCIGLAALLAGLPVYAQDNQPTPELHRLGQQLFKANCAICHGDTGAGDGSLAKEFSPRPRNFTINAFRFVSTPNGAPPARNDIVKTIRRGIEGSYGRSMPAFPQFSSSELLALTEVVRQLAQIEEYGRSVTVPPQPPMNFEAAKQAYENLGCSACHGEKGKGNGPAASGLLDETNQPIKPADFTTGKFKGGSDIEEIWLRIHNGVPGTPMPSFGQNADLSDIWSVTMMVILFGSN